MTGQGIGGIFACVADIGSKIGKKIEACYSIINSLTSGQKLIAVNFC